MTRLMLCCLLLLPAAAYSQEESDAEAMPAVSEQEGPDGPTLALQLQAVLGEINKQIAVIKTRTAAGDVRGAQEAKAGLEELRDKLALLVPVEEAPPEAPKASAADRALSVQISDLRSALTLYSAEHSGDFPTKLEALVPKYLKEIPKPALARHPNAPAPRQFAKIGQVDALDAQLKDTGAWLYVSDPESPLYGSLLVDCTHQNASGQEWFKE